MQFFPRKLLFALGLTGLLLLTTAACGGRNPGYQQSVPNHPTVSTSTPYHAISAPATPSPTPYPISTATPAPIPTSPKNVWFQTSCKDTSIEATIKPGQSVNIEYKTGNRAGKISIGVEQIVSQASRNTATFILSGRSQTLKMMKTEKYYI